VDIASEYLTDHSPETVPPEAKGNLLQILTDFGSGVPPETEWLLLWLTGIAGKVYMCLKRQRGMRLPIINKAGKVLLRSALRYVLNCCYCKDVSRGYAILLAMGAIHKFGQKPKFKSRYWPTKRRQLLHANKLQRRVVKDLNEMVLNHEECMIEKAKGLGSSSPEERILKDPQYAFCMCARHRWGVGWPGTANALAAAMALLARRSVRLPMPLTLPMRRLRATRSLC